MSTSDCSLKLKSLKDPTCICTSRIENFIYMSVLRWLRMIANSRMFVLIVWRCLYMIAISRMFVLIV